MARSEGLVVFDIETGPLPNEQLQPFDPNDVKTGNLKDPEKIAAKRKQAEQEWRSKLALSALTGRVLAIGLKFGKDEPAIVTIGEDYPEAELLSWFWRSYTKFRSWKWVGFNSGHFDLPFLLRRSLLLGVAPTQGAIDHRGSWHHSFVDLLDLWRCGDRTLYVKLDDLARAFGIDGKLEGVSGADFAGLLDTDREKAIAYLEQDLNVTRSLAIAMGA